MLGLTLECARCHDHKFDPITQRDYFSLFAFFNNIDESGLYSHFTNATPTPALLLWPAGRIEPRDRIAARIAETERHLKVLARSARGPFEKWIASAPPLRTPAPVAHLAFDAVDRRVDTTPDRRGRRRDACSRRRRMRRRNPHACRMVRSSSGNPRRARTARCDSAATTASCTRARRRSGAPIPFRCRSG